MTASRRLAGPTPKTKQPEPVQRVFDRHDIHRGIRVSVDRQASATEQRLPPWSLPNPRRKTVFFFVSFH